MDLDKLIVFVDLDGVVADFAQAVRELVECSSFTAHEDPSLGWDIFARLQCTPAQQVELEGMIFATPDFYRGLSVSAAVTCEVAAKLREVADRHVLNILTSRLPTAGTAVYDQTRWWLRDKLRLPLTTNILVAQDKAPVVRAMRADVVIDDDPRYLMEFVAQGRRVLHGARPKVFSPASTEQIRGVDASGMLGLVDFCLGF